MIRSTVALHVAIHAFSSEHTKKLMMRLRSVLSLQLYSVPVFKGNVCDVESSYDAVDVGLTKEVLDLCDGWD